MFQKIKKITCLSNAGPVKRTLNFYEDNAEAYFDKTVNATLDAEYERFLLKLPKHARILDAGSGSGRDTKKFQNLGYEVDAFDASSALAKISSSFTGVKTQVATFHDWEGKADYYDGIWAFASLLHVQRTKLHTVLDKLTKTLKPGGHFFACFKYGKTDTTDNHGRKFTNMTRQSATKLFSAIALLDEMEVWQSAASSAHGDATVWVYVLARRTQSD